MPKRKQQQPEKEKYDRQEEEKAAARGASSSSSWVAVLVVAALAAAVVVGLFLPAEPNPRYPELALRRRTHRERSAAQEEIQTLRSTGTAEELRVRIAQERDIAAGESWLAARRFPRPPHFCLAANTGAPLPSLPSHAICDGVLDCCDGRDEAGCPQIPLLPVSNVSAASCGPVIDVKIEELRSRIRTVDAAMTAQDHVVAHNNLTWVALRQLVDRATEELRNIPPEQYTQEVRQYAVQVMGLSQLEEKDFGRDHVLLPLLNKCFSLRDNERHFKGGCAEPEAHDFEFTFCPFIQVVQQKVPPQGAEPESPIFLGKLVGWNQSAMSAVYNQDATDREVQVYAGGAPCYNGPDRQVLVSYECHSQNELLAVRENGKCTYEMKFGTPLACRHADLFTLQDHLEALLEE